MAVLLWIRRYGWLLLSLLLQMRYPFPTGEILPVEGTPMDFTEMKPLGRDIDEPYEALILGHGYDHNWVLDHDPGILSLAAKSRRIKERTYDGDVYGSSRHPALYSQFPE